MKTFIIARCSAFSILVLLVTLVISNPVATYAETKGVILKPIEDGYVDSLQPTVNFAGSNLVVEYFYIRPQNRQRWGFLLFDLESIPPNSSIRSAELYIYAFEIHGIIRVGAFRGLDTSWSEKDLYWTLARQSSITQTSNNSQQITNAAWYHFDVRKGVQDSLATNRLTLVLRPDYSQGFEYAASAVFYSNDQPGRSNTPRLEIVYTTEPQKPSKQATELRLSIDPSRTLLGMNTTLSGSLRANGFPLAGQYVKIENSSDGSGWSLISAVETDQEGEFTLTWEADRIGNIKFRARYMGDENYYGAESTAQLEVESPATSKTDLTYPILIAILVAASALAVIWRTRRVRVRPRSTLGSEVAVPAAVKKAPPETLEPIRKETVGHISTGHRGLDRLLEGGLRLGYAVALTSPTCDELDLFTHGFLEAGLQANSSMLYLTTKFTGELDLASKYPSRFHCVICNPQAAPKTPRPNVHIVRNLDSLTEINLAVARVLGEMEKTIQENVAYMDFVSDILLQHGPVATRQWLLDFISRMKSKSVTMLATVNPQMHSSADLESIVGLFDGEISIWEQETAGTLQKLIGVRRMYRERYSAEPLPISKEDLS